jgi:hypothetical protein
MESANADDLLKIKSSFPPQRLRQRHRNRSLFIKFKFMEVTMEFFSSAVGTLQTLVIALGAGLAVWGAVNLLEGYGSDNPAAKSQGIKQLMAGGGVVLIGTTLVPLLSSLF